MPHVTFLLSALLRSIRPLSISSHEGTAQQQQLVSYRLLQQRRSRRVVTCSYDFLGCHQGLCVCCVVCSTE